MRTFLKNFHYELRFISIPSYNWFCTHVVAGEKKLRGNSEQICAFTAFGRCKWMPIPFHSWGGKKRGGRRGSQIYSRHENYFTLAVHCPLDPSSAPVLLQWNHSVAVNRKIAPGSLLPRLSTCPTLLSFPRTHIQAYVDFFFLPLFLFSLFIFSSVL